MNEKILKKLEILIDKTLDATLADRGLKTSQKEALTVIETVTDTLKTLDKNRSCGGKCAGVENHVRKQRRNKN